MMSAHMICDSYTRQFFLMSIVYMVFEYINKVGLGVMYIRF